MRAFSSIRRPSARGRLAATLAVLLLALAGLPGCGGPDEEPIEVLLGRLQRGDEAAVESVVETIGRRGREDTDDVVPALIEALRTEQRNSLVNEVRFTVDLSGADLEPVERSPALAAVSRTMARRTRAYGYSGSFTVEPAESAVLLRAARPQMATPEEEARFLGQLMERLAAPGTFELLIEVVPPGDDAAQPSLWGASRKSFETFLEEETPRLLETLRAHRPYVPSRADFRVSLVRPESADAEPGLVVLRTPAGEDERFDQDDLGLKAGVHEATGDIVLEISVATARRESLAAWSAVHRNRRMALVVNGRTEVLVPLTEPLGATFLLHLGNREDPRSRAWLTGILRAVSSGAHAYPVTAGIVDEVPVDAVTPLVRCLVAVGEPAAPFLLEAVREGGRFGTRARRTLEHLRRSLSLRATGTPP